MNTKKLNNKGQMTIEAILILMIIVSVFTVVYKQINEKKMFEQLVTGPWAFVQGMIENGVWEDPETGRAQHPNRFKRRASPEPT